MKLANIFEARGGISTDSFEVEFEVERETPDGDYNPIDLIISGTVTSTSDAYGTGDSPTGYEVDIKRAVVKSTGKPFDVSTLSAAEVRAIEDEAIGY